MSQNPSVWVAIDGQKTGSRASRRVSESPPFERRLRACEGNAVRAPAVPAQSGSWGRLGGGRRGPLRCSRAGFAGAIRCSGGGIGRGAEPPSEFRKEGSYGSKHTA